VSDNGSRPGDGYVRLERGNRKDMARVDTVRDKCALGEWGDGKDTHLSHSLIREPFPFRLRDVTEGFDRGGGMRRKCDTYTA
jgi:hypothetical protein